MKPTTVFTTAAFGGFRKRDVLDYVSKIHKELETQNQEIERLGALVTQQEQWILWLESQQPSPQ